MSTLAARYLLWALLTIGGLCALGQGWQAWQQHRLTRAVHRATQAHAATVAAGQPPARAFDAAFYGLAGERREAARTLHLQQRRYDSTAALIPATGLPVLPARPPRYRPAP